MFNRLRIYTAILLAACAAATATALAAEDQSVKPYDDVRPQASLWHGQTPKDLTKVNPDELKKLLPTLWFNQDTVWPDSGKALAAQVMEDAKNPGLGVRGLHESGITGKGVNVAIIDQPMFSDHPEFAGQVAANKNFGLAAPGGGSMHGPAVTSLLVGQNIGAAPGAQVYFCGVSDNVNAADAGYFSQALDWIVAQNATLPAGSKIRVVSVSSAPGSKSVFPKNSETWDPACKRAEAAGILVLDCSRDGHRGIIGACYFNGGKRIESPSDCEPGFPQYPGADPDMLLVPTSPRTTAEEYTKGTFRYQYDGEGGVSWAIPYTAGVLAMGWQVRPDLSKEQMVKLLRLSAYVKDGYKIIDPVAFIKLVKNPEAALAAKDPSVEAEAPPTVDDEGIKAHDDVRQIRRRPAPKDLTKVDPEELRRLIPTLWFNQDTVWPDSCKAFAAKVMEDAKNPGLGVRALHKSGVTGKSINVAIIDQPLLQDHPEFAGRIAAYKNFCPGEGNRGSMSGPVVASLLVGKTIGTAPGARLYYASVPSWLGDAAYYAKALDWIVEQNAKLPGGSRIRVVSASVPQVGERTGARAKNADKWEAARERAEKAGILVLDCTPDHFIMGDCHLSGPNVESPSSWIPNRPRDDRARQTDILVPTGPRAAAEEYEKGTFRYQYFCSADSSNAIPYAAGVLAMGWQVRPELSKEKMVELLGKSAYVKDGYKIINPVAFIKLVRAQR